MVKKLFSMAMVLAAFVAGSAALGAAETSVTGKVGDAMCGARHMMDDAAACTRGCVKKGSDYALLVDDKVYTLKTTKDDLKAALDKLAGQQATVKGDVSGNTIQVTAVVAANKGHSLHGLLQLLCRQCAG